MTNYNQRSKGGGQKFSRGGNEFGRGSEMHSAVCADCGKTCEVPFKPNGMKPVYCKDCFGRNGGQVATNDYAKKPYNKERPSMPSSYAPKPMNTSNDSKKSDDLAKQMEIMNAKFDKLVRLAENLLSKFEMNTPEPIAQITQKNEDTVEKPESKKAAVKKSKK